MVGGVGKSNRQSKSKNYSTVSSKSEPKSTPSTKKKSFKKYLSTQSKDSLKSTFTSKLKHSGSEANNRTKVSGIGDVMILGIADS